MNSGTFWYVSSIIASLVIGSVLGAVAYTQINEANRSRFIVSCLKAQGTDLKFCQNLADGQ